jgi:hypothetical protein
MSSRVIDRPETALFRTATRAERRTPATPEEILSSLPYGTKNWKAVLMSLIKLHNAKHSTKNKGVLNRTGFRGGLLA